MASQKSANDQLQGKFDEEKTAHIRAESRIESLNTELNKKNEALLETQASLGDAQKLSAKLEAVSKAVSNKRNRFYYCIF